MTQKEKKKSKMYFGTPIQESQLSNTTKKKRS